MFKEKFKLKEKLKITSKTIAVVLIVVSMLTSCLYAVLTYQKNFATVKGMVIPSSINISDVVIDFGNITVNKEYSKNSSFTVNVIPQDKQVTVTIAFDKAKCNVTALNSFTITIMKQNIQLGILNSLDSAVSFLHKGNTAYTLIANIKTANITTTSPFQLVLNAKVEE